MYTIRATYISGKGYIAEVICENERFNEEVVYTTPVFADKLSAIIKAHKIYRTSFVPDFASYVL